MGRRNSRNNNRNRSQERTRSHNRTRSLSRSRRNSRNRRNRRHGGAAETGQPGYGVVAQPVQPGVMDPTKPGVVEPAQPGYGQRASQGASYVAQGVGRGATYAVQGVSRGTTQGLAAANTWAKGTGKCVRYIAAPGTPAAMGKPGRFTKLKSLGSTALRQDNKSYQSIKGDDVCGATEKCYASLEKGAIGPGYSYIPVDQLTQSEMETYSNSARQGSQTNIATPSSVPQEQRAQGDDPRWGEFQGDWYRVQGDCMGKLPLTQNVAVDIIARGGNRRRNSKNNKRRQSRNSRNRRSQNNRSNSRRNSRSNRHQRGGRYY